MYVTIDGEEYMYTPCAPKPDNEMLAENGMRLMLYHDRMGGPLFKIAEKGIMHAGWVIGHILE